MQEQQLHAINYLKDISQFPYFLEQKLSKLDKLYQSLDVSRNLKENKPIFRSNQYKVKPQFYRTAKFSSQAPSSEKQKKNISQSFARTVDCLKYPSQYSSINSRRSSALNSDKKPAFSKTLNFKTVETPTKSYELYKNIKNQMICSFYVGGTPIKPKKEKKFMEDYRYTEDSKGYRYTDKDKDNRSTITNKDHIKNQHQKYKRRIWHGRPPVKIIQQID